MRRLAIAAALMTLTLAGPALALRSFAALEGARPCPSAVPEPSAVVLFAVGIGISAWAMRRSNKRS